MEYHHGDILLLKKIITMMIIATTVLTPTKITKITIIGLFSIVTKYLVCIEMILKVNFFNKRKKKKIVEKLIFFYYRTTVL